MADIELNRLIGSNTYSIAIVPPTQASPYLEKMTGESIIKGYLTNQLSFGVQNQFEGLHSGFATQKAMEKGYTGANIVAGETNTDLGGNGGMLAVGGITETIARWTGASKPTFGFNVMFVATNSKHATNMIPFLKILLGGCLPSGTSGEGWQKGTMQAPYGYITGFTGSNEDEATDSESEGGNVSDSSVKGVWAVQVGKWFTAPKLVLNSCNINFSQQCSPYGGPLFAEAQLTFETWRLIKFDELDNYFRLGPRMVDKE